MIDKELYIERIAKIIRDADEVDIDFYVYLRRKKPRRGQTCHEYEDTGRLKITIKTRGHNGKGSL